MTTDAFTDAATAAYEDYVRTPKMNVGTFRDRIAEAYMDAAMWARDHLARQEATDAECIHVLNVLGTDLGQPTRTDFEWSQAAIRRCREALMAAKEAR